MARWCDRRLDGRDGERARVRLVRAGCSDARELGGVSRQARARPELSSLTTYIAPLDEIRVLCGNGALGCYRQNRSVALGETLPDGTTPEEVIRHEYGHHIALYRSNAPWQAIDWGPEELGIRRGHLRARGPQRGVPGQRGRALRSESRRGLGRDVPADGRAKAGITTATWPIIAPSLYPAEAALVAAEKDVVQPWTTGTQSVFRKSVAKGKTWWIPLSTPLDGSLAVTARLPRGGRARVELMAANRRTMLKRAVPRPARRAPHQGDRLRPAVLVRAGEPERQAGTRDRRRGDAVAPAPCSRLRGPRRVLASFAQSEPRAADAHIFEPCPHRSRGGSRCSRRRR